MNPVNVKRNSLLWLITATVLVSTSFGPKAKGGPVPQLTILTESFAPLSYEKKGVVTGFSVEVVETLLQKLGSKQTRKDFLMLPWARAYQVALARPNTLLFSTVYTSQRDDLFKWVGPLLESKEVVFAKKSRKYQSDSVELLKTLDIGTVRNDVAEQILLEKGMAINKLISNSNPINVAKMLDLDRIDAFAYGSVPARWYMQDLNLDPNDYEEIYELQKSAYYIAFSRSTPQWIVDRFQYELAILKQSGEFKKIAEGYPTIDADSLYLK